MHSAAIFRKGFLHVWRWSAKIFNWLITLKELSLSLCWVSAVNNDFDRIPIIINLVVTITAQLYIILENKM